jgi:hypothetical protein
MTFNNLEYENKDPLKMKLHGVFKISYRLFDRLWLSLNAIFGLDE